MEQLLDSSPTSAAGVRSLGDLASLRLLDRISAIFFLAALVGIVTNAILIGHAPARGVVYPRHSSLWLAAMLALFAPQVALQARAQLTSTLWLYYYLAAASAGSLLFLAHALGSRAGTAAWAFVLGLCLFLNAFVASRGRQTFFIGIDASTDDEQPLLASEEGAEDSTSVVDGPAGLVDNDIDLAPSMVSRVLRAGNGFLLAVALPLLFLLVVGAWIQASGYLRHRPRGTFHRVIYADGTSVSIMAYCAGPRDPSLPAFFFDIGGGGHSSSDLHGLEQELVGLGRRVCSYDYPGTGWSGYATSGSQTGEPIIGQLARAMGEPGPFVLVGTMDGGPERVYDYALREPEMVAGIVVLGYGPGEFPTYAAARGMPHDETVKYAAATLRGRLALGNAILAVGVPLGLMPLLVPHDPDYVPKELEGEKRFLNLLNDKQWATQADYLRRAAENPETQFRPSLWDCNRTLDARIPVLVLAEKPDGEERCRRMGLPPDGAECRYVIKEAEMAREFLERMAAVVPKGRLALCEGCEGFLTGGSNMEWTVREIMGSFGQ
ncbi:hypothetical protein DFJ74DRAFT_672729 [Hyaloraphidium curvatum]|nr:hypothetical protein DFJ74DRAFT_672729 [Hyaloraphidium curvatum]